jgi:hypothetical protein
MPLDFITLIIFGEESNCNVSRYAIFFISLSLPVSQIKIFAPAPSSQVPTIHVYSLGRRSHLFEHLMKFGIKDLDKTYLKVRLDVSVAAIFIVDCSCGSLVKMV